MWDDAENGCGTDEVGRSDRLGTRLGTVRQTHRKVASLCVRRHLVPQKTQNQSLRRKRPVRPLPRCPKDDAMLKNSYLATAVLALPLAFGGLASAQTAAKKPNIIMIMADNVGIWNISAYHRGMMGGSTPNIDRIAKEGALFTDYYAQQSCTAGRAPFILGQTPFRARLFKASVPYST